MAEPSQKTDQRQHIVAIVREDVSERRRRTTTQEFEVQSRNGVTGHVTRALHAQHALLERSESTIIECVAPHAPRRAHQIDVWEVSPPAAPLQNEPSLQKRHIEAAAVEGDDAARAVEERRERGEERRLLVEIAHEELRPAQAIAVDPRGT